jgi:hypothetical protein
MAISAICEAQVARPDQPLTRQRYIEWRSNEIERDPRRAYALPSFFTIRRRLGGWRLVRTLARDFIKTQRNQ